MGKIEWIYTQTLFTFLCFCLENHAKLSCLGEVLGWFQLNTIVFLWVFVLTGLTLEKLLNLSLTPNREWTNNIPFTGWTGQRHLTAMPGSCTSKVDGEMFPGFFGILPKHLNKIEWWIDRGEAQLHEKETA